VAVGRPASRAGRAKVVLKEYGAGRVVEPTPEKGRFDLMVDNLGELATLMES
jgi:hypothetical protein